MGVRKKYICAPPWVDSPSVTLTSDDPAFARCNSVCIGATVSWVLAATFSLGFKIDLYTGILVVMIVGMAVDYAVHFTHFYNEAQGNRYEKAQGALHGVGVSVRRRH